MAAALRPRSERPPQVIRLDARRPAPRLLTGVRRINVFVLHARREQLWLAVVREHCQVHARVRPHVRDDGGMLALAVAHVRTKQNDAAKRWLLFRHRSPICWENGRRACSPVAPPTGSPNAIAWVIANLGGLTFAFVCPIIWTCLGIGPERLQGRRPGLNEAEHRRDGHRS